MLFNSYEYIFLFLPGVIALFFLIGRFRKTDLQLAVLVVASLVFYASWRPDHLPIILLSMSSNYFFGARIAGDATRTKAWVYTGVIFNLSLLAVFKYSYFFMGEITRLFNPDLDWSFLRLILPLGISFYTFQQISFLVDLYRKRITIPRPLEYVTYITFFPQLVAGPIVYFKDFLPNLKNRFFGKFSWHCLWSGFILFSFGLAKKVLLADNLAPTVDNLHRLVESGAVVDAPSAWLGALAFITQIYFDFSGYSDMALGVGLMFRIRLPINFNSPYAARNMSDFWKRWHITLTFFMRDYLFFPLARRFRNTAFKYINRVITMLLIGLWHGAGYTFLGYGLVHGVILAVYRAWREYAPVEKLKGMTSAFLYSFLSTALTYTCFVLGGVFFRSASLESSLNLYGSMFGLARSPASHMPAGWDLAFVFLAAALTWFGPNSQELLYKHRPSITRIAPYSGAPKIFYSIANDYVLSLAGVTLFIVSILSMWAPAPFIYFVF